MRFSRQPIELSVFLTLFLGCATTAADAHGASCSDLSEHETVLKEGESSVQSGGGSMREIEGIADLPTSHYVDRPSVFSYEQGERYLLSNIMSDAKISVIQLSTPSEVTSAQWNARICEMADRYRSAKEIYSKVLFAQRFQLASPKAAIQETLKDIERVELALNLESVESLFFANPIRIQTAFKKLADSISGNELLDVRTK